MRHCGRVAKPDIRTRFELLDLICAIPWARHVERARQGGRPVAVADVAVSFPQAVVDVLVSKAVRACRQERVDTRLLVGRVAANRALRAALEAACAAAGLTLRIPPPRRCPDNGAMIAALGDLIIRAGMAPAGLGVVANPSGPLTGSCVP
jgi:N6-L-threonylcarbamoyladenine synthase